DDAGLEEMRGRVGRGAVPVLDAGTRVLGLALTKGAGALAALLHASDAFVDHQNLSAGVAVPVRTVAGFPDRARRRRAVDDDVGYGLLRVDAGRDRSRRRLAGTRGRRGLSRRLRITLPVRR